MFLGTSFNARKCEILNPEALIIDFDDVTGIMKVSSKNTLKIRSLNLGYNIDYLLYEFTYDTKKSRVFFQGYPKFTKIEGKKRSVKNWENNRVRAYHGSINHFLSSAVNNKLPEEGFSIYRVKKFRNLSRPAEKKIKLVKDKIANSKQEGKDAKLSLREKKILRKSNKHKYVEKLAESNPQDTLRIVKKEGDRIFLNFEESINIKYRGEPAEEDYPDYKVSPNAQQTIISLTNGPTEILPNGFILNPKDVLFKGYMGWEKLGDMLPVDYKLPESKNNKSAKKAGK